MTKIVLLSGGMDSTTLLYDLTRYSDVHAVLFDYGQAHSQELVWAKHHCGKIGVNFNTVSITQLRGSTLTDGTGTHVVPLRNTVMLSFACNIAESIYSTDVYIGCNKDDESGFPDCGKRFLNQFNSCLDSQDCGVRIFAPYLKMTKREVAERGLVCGVKFNETWSCYKGGSKPCEKCSACEKRKVALCGL